MKKSSNHKAAKKKTPKKKQATASSQLQAKKTNSTKTNSQYCEEDFAPSAEFDVEENGESNANPNSDSCTKPSPALNDRLSPIELKNLVAHIVQLDEVYETSLSELDKFAYKKKQEWDFLFDDLYLWEPLQITLAACRELRDEGLKPSNEVFSFRLKELSIKLAEDSHADLFDDDLGEYLNELESAKGLSYKHGITLLQKQLRLQARRVIVDRREHQLVEAANRIFERMQEIEALATPQFLLASERFSPVLENIKSHRGSALLGLKSGLDNLDKKTRGLRDLIVICAPPGQGKTALILEVIHGVLQHVHENDCAVLLLSLEMNEVEIVVRMLSRLSGLQEDVIYCGDDFTENDCLDPKTREKLTKAEHKYKQISKRMMLVDAPQLDSKPPTERQILAMVDHLKKTAKTSHVLVVVDYLQLLDTGGQEGLQADRHQFQQLQNVKHAGYTVVAISESRKPASSKDAWTTGLADIKGDGRLGYGASGVFLIRPMTNQEVARCYGKPSTWIKKGSGTTVVLNQFLKKLENEGKAPVCLFIDKMRAPGRRGSLFFEFDYLRNRMKPMEIGGFSDLPGDELENNVPNPGAEV